MALNELLEGLANHHHPHRHSEVDAPHRQRKTGPVTAPRTPAAGPPRHRSPGGESDPAAPRPVSGGITEDIPRIWSRLLKTEVGPDDNFFEWGGNSLLVLRTLSEMQRRRIPKPSVREFHDNSTAAQFIRLVSGLEANT
ncbi:phosphopantetheine-binding protein [Streptomyces sp. NPDC017991]|uniref:phosphopantetheine-binding protein n=1 Tax=Streptomyces sp. NPDC017991 TaxID=3365026 RepID=UPI0037BC8883